jgi:predicted ATPase/class 3 adenylate cyclase
MAARSQTVTILFTDLVSSTALLQRVGDKQAQPIFQAHHRLLREAVEAHGGHEVSWLGDGLMVAFDSTLDAVKCAIAMQQASRRPTAGERLQIRAGLNVGEAFVGDSNYFGSPVVIARRLCDRAGAGQVFASDLVARLLGARLRDFRTNDLGSLELKGISEPVPAVEFLYAQDATVLLRKLPFVGRGNEHERLIEKLAAARSGHGSVVLLAGEPGIGKTRLTEEFCEQAASSATVIRGNCYHEAAPFGPWIEALRSLVEQLSAEELRLALADRAADIVPVVPEIKRRLPDLREDALLEPESQRARFIESIVAFISNAADRRPLALVLDDLHWCDRPSLMLIERVSRAVADRRVLILGTYRDVEVDHAHPLAQTLAAVRRLEHHERISLRGLPEDSVYELLTNLDASETGGPIRRALAAALNREAQGNPLFIREIFNSLVETGKLDLREGGLREVASIEELGIPEGVKEVIGRRLARLSEGCNRMLQLASVLGGRCSWDQLRLVMSAEPGEGSEEQVLNWLDEALKAQILSEQDGPTYSFTHALIMGTIYEALSRPRRALLHRRVGTTLERLYARDADSHASELAHHFYQAAVAGEVEKAITWSQRAARAATRQYAWEDAVRHYERALDIAELAPAFDDAARVDLLINLAEARLVVGGDEGQRQQIAARAVELARGLGDGVRFGRAALAWAGPHREDNVTNHPLIALLEEALGVVGPEDTAIRATLLARLQAALFYLPGMRERRTALHDEALAIARRVGDTGALLYVLRLGCWLWDPGNAEAQIAMGREMLSIAQAAGDESMAMDAYATLIGPMLELGDCDGADAAIESYAKAQRKVRRPGWTSTWRAMQASLEGRLRDVPALVRESVRELQQMNPENATNAGNTQTWNYCRLRGRLGDLEGGTEREARRFPEMPSYSAALAVANLAAGHLDQARAHFDELASRGFAAYHFDRNWTTLMCYLADACTGLEDAVRASELYERLEPYQHLCAITSHSCIATDYVGSLHLRLANLATTMRRWQDAERHYEVAVEIDRRLRAGSWLARTELDYAAMLLLRSDPGDSERAHSLLESALAFARAAGMEGIRAESERLLASPGGSQAGTAQVAGRPAQAT